MSGYYVISISCTYLLNLIIMCLWIVTLKLRQLKYSKICRTIHVYISYSFTCVRVNHVRLGCDKDLKYIFCPTFKRESKSKVVTSMVNV